MYPLTLWLSITSILQSMPQYFTEARVPLPLPDPATGVACATSSDSPMTDAVRGVQGFVRRTNGGDGGQCINHNENGCTLLYDCPVYDIAAWICGRKGSTTCNDTAAALDNLATNCNGTKLGSTWAPRTGGQVTVGAPESGIFVSLARWSKNLPHSSEL